MDIVLVGLPGSGKSAVGRRLAHRHGATFIDLDEAIEKAAGRSIPQIFEDRGEDGFRAIERQAVADLGQPDPDAAIRTVVATGGGAVAQPVGALPPPPPGLARRPTRGARAASSALAERPAVDPGP